MNSVSIDELNQVLDQLYEKRDELQDQIDNNSLILSEMDSASSKLDVSDSDYDIFSPRRKSGAKHKVQLERDRTEYEEQNNQLFLERNKINILIEAIQRVLDAEQNSDREEETGSDPEKKTDPDQDTASASESAASPDSDKETHKMKKGFPERDLSVISHKIELCRKFVDQDPRRAKVELDGLQKKLSRLIEKISREKGN